MCTPLPDVRVLCACAKDPGGAVCLTFDLFEELTLVTTSGWFRPVITLMWTEPAEPPEPLVVGG